jgi:3,4-dihydroxy 2-butanone 4-phosphate synthase/GTP cyclohydrolase II
VHLHSECLTGEAFGSHRCDCGSQLKAALEGTGREPGVLVYLRQEGRRIGLVNKLRAYSFQDGGLDTVEANVELGHRPDERSYAAATAVLRKLGLERVRLITNNPDKYEAVRCSGIRAQRVALGVGRHPADESYIAAKALRMGQRVAAARL